MGTESSASVYVSVSLRRILHKILLCIPTFIIVAATALYAASTPAVKADASVVSKHRSLLDRYCVTCHNQKLKTAELTLDKLDVGNVTEDAPQWEKVIRKLRTAAMPPVGMPRPEPRDADALAAYLEAALDSASAVNPNPGRPAALHRLNRAEYANSIRDLLALDTDAVGITSLLPADDSGYGFDNIGDVLSVSPLLMERYMKAARQISRLAIGDASIRPAEQTYAVPRYFMQEDRTSEDLPFGSRGGTAIRHHFPLDGEYVIKIRLKRSYDGSVILGLLSEPHQIDVTLDGATVKVLTVGGSGFQTGPNLQPSAAYSKTDTPQNIALPADASLEVRLPVKAGSHLVGIAFLKEHISKPEGVFRPRGADLGDDPSLGSFTIAGPFDVKGAGKSTSRKRIFVCRPKGGSDAEPCARRILTTLAHRAYRRPVTDADARQLLAPYEAGAKQRGFDAGIEMAVRAMLVAPDFLFRIERDPQGAAPDAVSPVNDLELASRLSFFLWSSIPDGQLLELAETGKLRKPEVLEQQVRRMLADGRAKSLIQNFAGQWLYLRNVEKVTPDPKEFPDFDENLRQAFENETQLFFETMLREDRSVSDLLDADYTFVNERLARHYGIPNIYGSHFRRVTLDDQNRRGLLGQGSILTVTSYANRTSPTLRGKWLLENILGAPPPPPPANVPSLKDRGEDGKILSMRQQMEQHRKNPACAVCHARMDPLGFALENFDGLGKWREVSGGDRTPIDASGVLPDGTKFKGPSELRKILLSRRDQFVTVVVEKLLTYALGRGVEYYDEPAVRKILRQAAPDCRWSSIILGIVQSTPFQMRRSRPS